MSDGNGTRYELNGDAWRGGGAWRGSDGDPAVAKGPGYLYRPGHVLVAADQGYTDDVVARLRGLGATRHEEYTAHFTQEGLALHAFELPADHHVPTVVDQLRERGQGEPVPYVTPNHVFTGEYIYEGGPEGGPHATAQGDESHVPPPGAGEARVAILDTGYDPAVRQLHPELAERLEAEGDDYAVVERGYLAHEAGHGTFIAGIIMKHSPALHIRQVRVLDPAGLADDVTVALGLLRAGSAPVLNLSLGGYTQGGRPPMALATALAQLPDSVAVVAAAGNGAAENPFWPAAFTRVVGVGALDTTGTQPARAAFSNYGNWVDIYAPGKDVDSTYLQGIYQQADQHLTHLHGWATWSGTSFAAPQVAAEIAARIGEGVTARQAAVQVLQSAREVAGIGRVLLPDQGETWK